MARRNDAIRVENLREVQRVIRQTGDRDLARALRAANRAAAQVVADRADDVAPKRSGKLAASIGARGESRQAVVKAGSAARVPYAGPIHYGWPRRGIRPQPFLYEALDDRREQVRQRYSVLLDALVQDVNRRL